MSSPLAAEANQIHEEVLLLIIIMAGVGCPPILLCHNVGVFKIQCRAKQLRHLVPFLDFSAFFSSEPDGTVPTCETVAFWKWSVTLIRAVDGLYLVGIIRVIQHIYVELVPSGGHAYDHVPFGTFARSVEVW